MATYTTYAQEKAQRVAAEREAPFRATHRYDPIGWDRFDPMSYDNRGDGAGPIEAGSLVQVLKQAVPAGPGRGRIDPLNKFRRVRDAHGTEQTVDVKSLQPKGRK